MSAIPPVTARQYDRYFRDALRGKPPEAAMLYVGSTGYGVPLGHSLDVAFRQHLHRVPAMKGLRRVTQHECHIAGRVLTYDGQSLPVGSDVEHLRLIWRPAFHAKKRFTYAQIELPTARVADYSIVVADGPAAEVRVDFHAAADPPYSTALFGWDEDAAEHERVAADIFAGFLPPRG